MLWKSFIQFHVTVLVFAALSVNATGIAENTFESAEMIDTGTYQGQFSGSNLEDGYIVHGTAGQELYIEAKFDPIVGTLSDPRSALWCNMNIYNMYRKNVLPYCGDTCRVYTDTDETGIVSISWLSSTDEDYYIILDEDPYSADTGYAKYKLEVSLTERYDANSGVDAGDHPDSALRISPGIYTGYLAKAPSRYMVRESYPRGNDLGDFYRLSLAMGQTITAEAKPELDGAVGLVLIGDEGEIGRVYPSSKGEIVKISWEAASNQEVYVGVTTMEKDKDLSDYVGTARGIYVGGRYTLEVEVKP